MTARAEVPADPDERPLGRAAIASSRPRSTTVVKSRPGRPEPSRLMNAPAAAQPVFPDDGLDEEDEQLDPREVRRQARELAATIDTSSIQINVGDLDKGDKPVLGAPVFRFSDMWAEGASARESGAKAKPAAKRKARR